MRFVRQVVLSLLIVVGTGCSARAATTRPAGGSSSIAQAEIRTAQLSNAYDVVERLRPDWLRTRGVDGDLRILVYLDNAPYGEADALRQISAGMVTAIDLLRGSEVNTMLTSMSARGVGAVIHVHTTTRDSRAASFAAPRVAKGLSVSLLPGGHWGTTAAGMDDALQNDGWNESLISGEVLPGPSADRGTLAVGFHYTLRAPFGLEVVTSLPNASSAVGYKRDGGGVITAQLRSQHTAALLTYGDALRVSAGPGLARTQGTWSRRNSNQREAWTDTRLGVVADLSVRFPRNSTVFLEARTHARAFADQDLAPYGTFPGAQIRDRSVFFAIGGGVRY
ncbi:MAG: hypothetical protein ACRELT_14315 [Longimicrobiales bacterium]